MLNKTYTDDLTKIGDQFIEVYISNQNEILYNGKAKAFNSENSLGKFSIIPKHTNFRSIIYKKMSVIPLIGDKKNFIFTKGVLSFSENKLEVYIV